MLPSTIEMHDQWPSNTPLAGFENYSTDDLEISEPTGEDMEFLVDDEQDEFGEILLPRPGFGRCRFAPLVPATDGVGPYHVNNHIGFFNPPSGFTISAQLDSFYRNFPSIFTPGNLARALAPSCRVGGQITVQFILKSLPGLIHDDWVSMKKNSGNFVATTLERKFWSRGDMFLDTGATVALGLSGAFFAGVSADINRRHFLAGLRSWTLGRLPNGLHFVETAAFERYSHPAYLASSGVVGMRAQILEIWTKLVENYVSSIGATLVSHVPAGYSVNRRVAHREAQHASGSTLRADPWFASVLSRHPGL